MRRLLAWILLSLVLTPSALAERDWRTLYLPLATAKGPAFDAAVEDIVRQHDANLKNPKAISLSQLDEETTRAICKYVDTAYDKGSERERRKLLRLAAIVTSPFGTSEAPQYSSCGVISFRTDSELWARCNRWLENQPSAHLGLLDDQDPRVAEAAVRVLHSHFPDEVEERLHAWKRDPRPHFRGIVAANSEGLTDGREIRLQMLDDPSPDVRRLTISTMRNEAMEAYASRRPSFAIASWTQRHVIFLLAQKIEHVAAFIGAPVPDIANLGVACLEAPDPQIRTDALTDLTLNRREVRVALPTLLRLLKDQNREIGAMARELSERQGAVRE